jgi:hypothetical protein
MLRALAAGTLSYLIKTMQPEEMVDALRSLHAGNLIYPDNFLVNQLRNKLHKTSDPNGRHKITPRQLAVLQCLSHGMTDKIIAIELDITESTEKYHIIHGCFLYKVDNLFDVRPLVRITDFRTGYSQTARPLPVPVADSWSARRHCIPRIFYWYVGWRNGRPRRDNRFRTPAHSPPR